MNVQRESLSATTTPAALTCQGGTTVSAEAVSMTMGPIHCPGSPVLVSSFQPHPPSVRPLAGGVASFGTLFSSWCSIMTPPWLNSSVVKFSPSATHGLGWGLCSVGF